MNPINWKKTTLKGIKTVAFLAITAFLFIFSYSKTTVSNKNQVVRIAKLEIDSAQLDAYKAYLKEEIEASVRIEAGVLTLYAVADKKKPTRITIFETYADTAAYRSHIETPHFKKYKVGTKEMVKALELIDVLPVALEAKTVKN